jgi:hypothetical protein
MMRSCALALVLVGIAGHPAHACHKRHQTPFELFDDAATVAVVKVTSTTTSEARLRVISSVKGTNAHELTARETNTSCHVGFRRGRRGLVFLGADGWPTGMYEGWQTDLASWQSLIERYAQASDDRARTGVVLDALTSSDKNVAQDGASYLVDHPELLAQVDADALARITKAGPDAWIDSMLPAVLIRLGDARGAADLMAAHRFTHANAFARLSVAMRFEAVSDENALADAIRDGTDDADRLAAFERCERVRTRSLLPFTTYIGGVNHTRWQALADACRSGTPVPR